jgi:hypothetical protein
MGLLIRYGIDAVLTGPSTELAGVEFGIPGSFFGDFTACQVLSARGQLVALAHPDTPRFVAIILLSS